MRRARFKVQSSRSSLVRTVRPESALPATAPVASGTRYAVPADVLYALERVFDQPDLGRIAVIYRPWYVRVHLLFLKARRGSVTRPERIYTNLPARVFFAADLHVLHEYYHVVQQWGRERMSRAGYLLNSGDREREACDFAAAHADDYRVLRTQARMIVGPGARRT